MTVEPERRPMARAFVGGRRWLVAVALGGLAVGCETSDALTAPVVLDTQLAASEASRQTARAVEEARAAEQRRRADAEAEAERLRIEAEAEAKRRAEEEARLLAEEEGRRPVSLTEIAVDRAAGSVGRRGTLEVSATARINQALASSSYVHVKSRCKDGEALVADVGHLAASLTKPLDQHAIGESVEVRGTLYAQGLSGVLSPCQLELRVGGAGPGLSVPLGEACWTGRAVTRGPCDPALVPVPTSGSEPLEVTAIEPRAGAMAGPGKPGTGDGGRLHLDYRLEVHEPQASDVRITFKSACRIDGKIYADLGQTNLAAGPFRYDSGETIARTAELYWNTLYGDLSAPPDDCDLVVSLWRTKPGTLGEPERRTLAEHCLRSGALTTGPCDPSAPVPGPIAPMTASSVTIDGVVAQWGEAWGATGKVQLNLRADLTLAHSVAQTDGVSATVECKDKAGTHTDSAFLFGVEPHVLAPGETARMTATAFGSVPLDAEPRACTIELLGGPRFSPGGGAGVTLGTLCLQRGKVTKKRKC